MESNPKPQWRHRWEVGGSNPVPSECSMQGWPTRTSQHGTARTHLLAPTRTHFRLDFSIPQHHMVRGVLAWERYCRGYRMHLLPTGGTGLISFIKGQGKVGPYYPSHLIHNHAPMLQKWILLMHGAETWTWALFLRADTLKCCLYERTILVEGFNPNLIRP